MEQNPTPDEKSDSEDLPDLIWESSETDQQQSEDNNNINKLIEQQPTSGEMLVKIVHDLIWESSETDQQQSEDNNNEDADNINKLISKTLDLVKLFDGPVQANEINPKNLTGPIRQTSPRYDHNTSRSSNSFDNFRFWLADRQNDLNDNYKLAFGDIFPGMPTAGMNPFNLVLPTNLIYNSSVDLYGMIKASLFISVHQRKLTNVPLLAVDSFCNYMVKDYTRYLAHIPQFTTAAFHGVSEIQICITLNDSKTAKTRLYNYCPLLEDLNFNGYVIAGGGPCFAVRNLFPVYVDFAPSDLDIFIIVPDENDPIRKEMRANQILKNILTEIDISLKKRFQNNYRVRIIESEQAISVKIYRIDASFHDGANNDIFHNDVKWQDLLEPSDLPVDAHSISGNVLKSWTIQIIKRVYSYESEILLGFDLGASQCLFDGRTFKCTDLFRTSILLNTLVLDISRASNSWASRLHKYNTHKRFSLLFVGLNKHELKSKFIQPVRTGRKDNWVFAETDAIKFTPGFYLCPTIDHTGGHTVKPYEFHLILTKEGQRHLSDYSSNDPECITSPSYANILDLICRNIRVFLRGRTNLVLMSTSIQSFLKEPQIGNNREVYKYLCSGKNLPIEFIAEIFGCDAEAAAVSLLRKDMNNYTQLVNKRAEQLQLDMHILFEQLKRRSWNISDPNSQDSGSFYPLRLQARSFYGQLVFPISVPLKDSRLDFSIYTKQNLLYNGFQCTNHWAQKLTIIMSWKKRHLTNADNCLFNWLSRDVLKHIFSVLDELCVRGLLREY